jgi:hypothetical protein
LQTKVVTAGGQYTDSPVAIILHSHLIPDGIRVVVAVVLVEQAKKAKVLQVMQSVVQVALVFHTVSPVQQQFMAQAVVEVHLLQAQEVPEAAVELAATVEQVCQILLVEAKKAVEILDQAVVVVADLDQAPALVPMAEMAEMV